MDKEDHSKEALVEFLRALEIEPGNALAAQDIQKVKNEIDKKDRVLPESDGPSAEDLDRPGPPVHLDLIGTEPITLHMTEQSTILYQTIGRIAGLTVLIDPDTVSKRVTIDLKDATVTEALRALGDLSNSFWKASTHNAIYIAPDTRTKRTQLEQLAVRTFYLSNATQQSDLNDIITALRNVLPPTGKMFAVQSQNAIVVRGTPDEILLAKNLIVSLDTPKPEVLVDIYVMEVSSKKWIQITHDAGRCDFPSWSPDGRHLVYASTASGHSEIWTVLADGTGRQKLSSSGGNDMPNWSWK